MTTQTEAERLADQLEDPVNAKLYLAPYIAAELRRLVSFNQQLMDEVAEQCRINGMSAEREDALKAEVERLNKAVADEREACAKVCQDFIASVWKHGPDDAKVYATNICNSMSATIRARRNT